MIKFDAVDFSECRSEEVISFFWRSVYYKFKFKIYVACWLIALAKVSISFYLYFMVIKTLCLIF